MKGIYNRFSPLLSRREMLRSSGCGFGMLALSALLQENAAAERSTTDPVTARAAHFRPRAKRVIFLFLHGGVSPVDTFDPKPELVRHHGEPLPRELTEGVRLAFTNAKTARLKGSPRFSSAPCSDAVAWSHISGSPTYFSGRVESAIE